MTKVMVVEDDQSLREIYSIRLTAEGYEVVSAGDGEEALAIAMNEKPDLILSDVMMPKISGFDMLDILRSTPETRDIKVIMMTALSSDDQRRRGEGLGANKYLVKSQVGIEDVVGAIHDLLDENKANENDFGQALPAQAVQETEPTSEAQAYAMQEQVTVAPEVAQYNYAAAPATQETQAQEAQLQTSQEQAAAMSAQMPEVQVVQDQINPVATQTQMNPVMTPAPEAQNIQAQQQVAPVQEQVVAQSFPNPEEQVVTSAQAMSAPAESMVVQPDQNQVQAPVSPAQDTAAQTGIQGENYNDGQSTI